MQPITFERIIMLWPRRVLIVALAGVLIVALMPRPSIAGQQLPRPDAQLRRHRITDFLQAAP